MSRIDRALQSWEKKGGVAKPSFERESHNGHASTYFRLDGFEREGGGVVSPAAVANEKAADTVATAQPPSVAPRFAATPQVTPDMEARLVSVASASVPLEQYRRLAAILHDVQQQQGLRTLMFTSALPGEGKTLTTVNLALTLSASYDRRVLIVDADLRMPSVHRMLGVANDAGLSEALQSDRVELPLKQISPRLSLLTAGQTDVTPLAGLTSPRMAALVEQCASQFDWVLLDTPPVGLLPDAQLLARLTRAVVFVIGAGVTPAAAVTRAVAELGNDCIIGTILNRVNERQIPQAGYYSRYYQTQDSE